MTPEHRYIKLREYQERFFNYKETMIRITADLGEKKLQ